MTVQNTDPTPPPSALARPRTSFTGDVLKLVSGTMLAQAVGVLSAPLLTRMYGPEAFGVWSLFISITGVIGVVACLRYEPSILLPGSDEEAANLLGVSLSAAALVAGFTAFAIGFGRHWLLQWLKVPSLERYLWLVPPVVFIGGVYTALNHWNTRTRQFGRLSVARVANSLATFSTQLGAGYAGHATAGSLIGGSAIGSALATLLLGGQIWRDDKTLFWGSIRWPKMLLGLKRYRKFPLVSTWSALLNSLSWQLPIFLLSRFFSPTEVGYYALGTRVLQLPMSLVGASLGQVFFSRATTARNDGTLPGLVEGTFRQLVILGMFPLLVLSIVGQDLFVVVFGPNWAEAGVYVQILSIWMFLWFVSAPMITLVSVLEKQEWGLTFNVIIFVTRFLALWLGSQQGNARTALALFAVTGFLAYGSLNLALMSAAGVPWSKSFRILFSNFLLFLPIGIILGALSLLGTGPWIMLGAAGLGSIVYYAYVLKRNPELWRALAASRIGATLGLKTKKP
jgi:lipopolysaccharide exporter